jgi:hypothetical protein
MEGAESGDSFTAWPREVPVGEAADCRWCVYLMRIDLKRHRLPSALKLGMVGSGTVGQRRRRHENHFGDVELLGVWTLAHDAQRLEKEISGWRLVEQYEARLQFAQEFEDPTLRLRRLNPDGLLYSYEWFEDDQRVIDAIRRMALKPVSLPHGWSLATGPDEHGPTR